MNETTTRQLIAETAELAGSSAEADWDSLVQISVLIALNDAFAGRIADVPKVQEARNLEAMLSILKEAKLI